MLTSKQKLVLKSSKVFIKFKSGVFICNSCAISGWKLNFWSSWRVVKIDFNWMISGWIMNILTQKLGIQKVEFKSSFFTKISTNWSLGKKMGFKKLNLSRVVALRFPPAGWYLDESWIYWYRNWDLKSWV